VVTTIEFTFNNKIYIATKSSPFKVNYGQELRIDFEIRKKGKNVKEMKKIYKEVKAALTKL